MQRTPQTPVPRVLAYLAWLVSIAVCVAALLQFQSAVNVLGAALGANRYVLRLLNQVTLLLGGLAAFIYVVFLEGYYRDGIRAGGGRLGLLPQRFARTIAIPLAIAALCLVLVEIALRGINQAP